MKNFRTYKKGVTLIEVVVYAIIFAILGIAVIQVLAVLSRNFAGASRMRELATSAALSLDRITREIKEADTFVSASSTLSASPGILTIQSTHPTSTTRTIKFSVGSDGDLLVNENNGAEYSLTSANIDVESLIFRRVTGTSTLIKVELTLKHAQATTTRANFNASAVMRGTYQ